ncbi:hypothetical protein Tco_1498615, partial [Tanacetum coccineum]
QPVVAFTYPSANKSFEIPKDTSCLESFLYGEHKLLASVDVFPCPKPYVHPWISPVDSEFLDSVVQRFINLLQSAITELVDLIKPHDHLNPIFVSEDNYPWRIYDHEVMLILKSSGIPSRFGEV